MWKLASVIWAWLGKEQLWKKRGTFYEIADLGFGKCRFALASVKGTDVYSGYDFRNHCQ